MKIGKKIYTIYGWVTIRGKRYTPVGNKVVWYGVDEDGIELEISDSILLAPPQKEDGSTFKDFAKALGIQKGDKGEPGKTPIRGVDYYSKQQVESMISAWAKSVTPTKGVNYGTKAEIDDIIKKATPIKGKDYFDGVDGYTPIYGKDYFTRKQIKELILLITDQVKDRVKDGGRFVGNFETENDLPKPEREGDWAYVENTGRIWYT